MVRFMVKYNKLVRDRIPEIIKNRGDIAITHKASEKEYREKLKEKLREEVNEFIGDGSKDEIIDILEIVYAICDFKKIDRKKLEALRKKKAKDRGGFKKRIILDES